MTATKTREKTQADPLQWQKDYARELLRTSGKHATFEPYSSGWWTLLVDGAPSPGHKRRSDILQMTENLRRRDDHVSQPPQAS